MGGGTSREIVSFLSRACVREINEGSFVVGVQLFFRGRLGLFFILKGLALVKRIGFLIFNSLAFIINSMTEFDLTAIKK